METVIHLWYNWGLTPMLESEADYAAKLKRVSELRYVQRESRTEVAVALSKDPREPLTAANVNKWLDAARDLGVVTFDIDASFAIMGKTDDRLADVLARAFRLDEPLVIETAEDASPNSRSDTLHTALGNQTGKHVKISANSNLFVAGGRTVLQVARKISRKRVSKQNVRIDPLSGRNWTGSWHFGGADDLKRPLDADDAAVVLSSAFPESGNYYSQIGYPLYAETASQARVIMREHCAFLPDGRWNWDIAQRKLYRAICGIGALHPRSGHRIIRFLEAYLKDHGVHEDLENLITSGALGSVKLPGKPGRSAPYLSRVAIDLVDAISFSARKGLGYFGDLANRLYPCLPLPQTLVEREPPSVEDYAELLKKLDVLNSRALVAQWSHLRNANSWITAGGYLKLPAIWTLAIARDLEQEKSAGSESIMSQLTTDSTTAHELIRAKEAFDKSPRPVRQWYADLTAMIFRGQATKNVSGGR
jgi:hypothetical protein